MKRVHQCRLTDSGFTGDENDLPADRAALCAESYAVRPKRCPCPPISFVVPETRSGEANDRIVTYRRHELVSALGKGFNEFRFVVPVTQHLADFQYVFLNEFPDLHTSPATRLPESHLGSRVARDVHQIAQHIESLRRERHAVFPAPEGTGYRIKPK